MSNPIVEALKSAGVQMDEAAEKVVTEAVDAHVAAKVEAATASIKESVDAEVAKKVKAYKESIAGQLDTLFDSEILEWGNKNAVALENKLVVEKAQNVLGGLSTVLKENNLEITPDEQSNFDQLQEENGQLRHRLNTVLRENVTMKAEGAQIRMDAIITEAAGNASAVKVDKVRKLVIESNCKTEAEMRAKAKSFFELMSEAKKPAKGDGEDDKPDDENDDSDNADAGDNDDGKNGKMNEEAIPFG